MDFTNKSDSISQSGTISEIDGLTLPDFEFDLTLAALPPGDYTHFCAVTKWGSMDSAEVKGFVPLMGGAKSGDGVT